MNNINIGAIVEQIVRRSGLSITAFARHMKVNRRTIYSWFSQKTLSFEIVYKVGYVLGHNFYVEFIENYIKITHADKKLDNKYNVTSNYNNLFYWIDKYIKLLEKFNHQLEQNSNELINKLDNNNSFYNN